MGDKIEPELKSKLGKATDEIATKLFNHMVPLSGDERKHMEQEVKIFELHSLALEMLDYLYGRTDADYQGEESGFVPNDEMVLQMRIEEVLRKCGLPDKGDWGLL